MTKTTTVVRREAAFIPIKDLTPKLVQRLKEKLTFSFFNKEKICQECEWYAERINDVCESCANYRGSYELANQVKVGDNKYLKVPLGSWPTTKEYLERQGLDTVVKSKHPKTEIAEFKFKGEFREGQEAAIEAMLKYKRGILSAPPRSGKTLMGTVLTSRLKVKTLILASQRDWLMGFQETYIGSKTQEALTDLDPKRIKLCKTLKDFETHDICLATVQTFYSPAGEKLLRKIRDMFTCILIDEVHTVGADKYSMIASRLNAKYFIGFSGTPTRKDERETLFENIIGPVFYKMETKRMVPEVRLTRTGFTRVSKKGTVPWARLVSGLENDKKRIQVIASQALKDVESGHMVLIPVAQVKPVNKIVEEINKQAGKTIAYAFTGSLKKEDRDAYIQKARAYKIKVLVGTQKILSVGINIPRASCIFEVCMSSNLQAAQQRMARVLTHTDDKPRPIIRYFLDECTVRKSCMRNEFYRVLMPVFKPMISTKDKEMIESYFRSKPNVKFSI